MAQDVLALLQVRARLYVLGEQTGVQSGVTEVLEDVDHIGDINEMVFHALSSVETGGANLPDDRREKRERRAG
jgi:hypothetical protein